MFISRKPRPGATCRSPQAKAPKHPRECAARVPEGRDCFHPSNCVGVIHRGKGYIALVFSTCVGVLLRGARGQSSHPSNAHRHASSEQGMSLHPSAVHTHAPSGTRGRSPHPSNAHRHASSEQGMSPHPSAVHTHAPSGTRGRSPHPSNAHSKSRRLPARFARSIEQPIILPLPGAQCAPGSGISGGIVGTVSLCETDFPKLRIRESHLSPERGFSGVSAP